MRSDINSAFIAGYPNAEIKGTVELTDNSILLEVITRKSGVITLVYELGGHKLELLIKILSL